MASGTITNPFKAGASIQLSVVNNKISQPYMYVRQVGAFLVLSGYFHSTATIVHEEKMFDWPAGVPVPSGTNYLILTNGENKSAAWYANENGFFGYDNIPSKYWNIPTTVIPIS